jgi:hypothetical protein
MNELFENHEGREWGWGKGEGVGTSDIFSGLTAIGVDPI